MSIAPTQDLSFMPDAALKQALQTAQRANDTMKFLSIKAELDKRTQSRTAAQGQQAGQQMASAGPQTIADKVASGVANLPVHNEGYADGGIVAFAEGGQSRAQQWLSDFFKSSDEGKAAAEQASRRDRVLGTARDTQRALEERQASDADTAQGGLGYFVTPASVYKDPNYTPQTVRDSRNYGNETRRTPTVDPLPAASPSGIGPQNALNERDPALRAQAAAAMAKMSAGKGAPVAPGTGGAGRAGVSSSQRTAAPVGGIAPAGTNLDVPVTDSPEQLGVQRAKLAAKDDAGISAVYQRMADRDAAKQAKLTGETEGKEGLLGFKMSPAVREALLHAGIGAMTSTSPNMMAGLGAGLQAGAETYKAGETRRTTRQDLLDESADKRALAEIAAKQGNQERAGQLMSQSAALKTQAQTWTAEKAKIAQKDAELAQQAALKREEMANHLRGIGMQVAGNAANARLPSAEVQAVERIMKDKGIGYTEASQLYAGIRGSAAADLAGWKTYAADPAKLAALKIENPIMYAQVVSKIQGQLSGGSAPSGNAAVRER